MNAEFPGFPEAMRSEDEIGRAEQEYFERLWYYRHTSTPDGIPVPEALRHPGGAAAAERIRARLPDLKAADQFTAFDLGMISGKLSALRWVCGYDWDFLDT